MIKGKLINIILIITTLILLIPALLGCKRLIKTEDLQKQDSEWNEVVIDPEIKKEVVYKELDDQKEIYSVFEDEDPMGKRTSDVAYYFDDRKKEDFYAKFNNCRAIILRSDTLGINIGISNGFGGHGFGIAYFDKKFHTRPYYFDDVVFEGEVEPTFKVIYQKLILDKADYNIGDSIFGKIDFKSVEQGFNRGREHFGIGHFRAKIKKPEWEP